MMKMKLEQAVEIIEKALNIANSKGAFILKDAVVIQSALDTLINHFTPLEDQGEREVGIAPEEMVSPTTKKGSKK